LRSITRWKLWSAGGRIAEGFEFVMPSSKWASGSLGERISFRDREWVDSFLLRRSSAEIFGDSEMVNDAIGGFCDFRPREHAVCDSFVDALFKKKFRMAAG